MIYGGIRGVESRPINETDKAHLDSLFAQLETELKHSYAPGIGLAAVQIGMPIRVAIVRVPKDPNDPYGTETNLNLWNPKIIESTGMVLHTEGCLSIPSGQIVVKRAKTIVVENGDGKRYALEGIGAICVQHEIDHMDGLTIEDRRTEKPGRNDSCPCNSGKKYKKCCGD